MSGNHEITYALDFRTGRKQPNLLSTNSQRSSRQGSGAGIPRIAVGRDELVFAWTETAGGQSQIRTARAALPAVPIK